MCWIERVRLLVLTSLALAAGLPGIGRAERRIVDNWTAGWSGKHCQRDERSSLKTPDEETVLAFQWLKEDPAELPTAGRSVPSMPLDGDVVSFWVRVDRPIEFMQVVLSDADGVGAETGVAGLLGLKTLQPGRWHYIVWPFRAKPGWVRYKRGVVDWGRIVSVSLYTRPDQLKDRIRVELGPFHLLTFSELGEVFGRWPDRVSNNAGLPFRVISGRRTDLMVLHYYRRVVRQKVADLQKKYPASQFDRHADELRKALARSYGMPPTAGAQPVARPLGTVSVGGVQIERQLLRLRPGVCSTAWIYKPRAEKGKPAGTRHPAIMMLPGHGDPGWSPAVQSRCLGFVEQGYLVMLVEPFGQDERGEMPHYNESHESQAAAFLMTTGQGLLGLIMADHQSELTYLCSRGDVDPERIGVTGVSMGGTHSIWLAAIEPRIKVCVPDAAGPMTAIDSGMGIGLCDLMIGLYDVAYDEMIRALIAPRPYLEIIPDVQRPISAEHRLLDEGWINSEDAIKQYQLTREEVARQHPYALEVYARSKSADCYKEMVITGPHDYTKTMRETAAGWFGRFLQGNQGIDPIPEPPLAPIANRRQAVATLAFWPDGVRPQEMLTPTAYVQREVAGLIAKLPAAPATLTDFKDRRTDIKQRVAQLLKVPLASPGARLQKVAELRAGESKIGKLIVIPEEGIELPMVLSSPAEKAKPNGTLYVLLHPSGIAATAGTTEQRKLSGEGAWVLCVDLRGMGETAYGQESGMYLGFRDYCLCVAALKLGGTQAGFWTKDLLAAISAARSFIRNEVKVVVRADRETALVAILAAGQAGSIDAVETTGLLASYHSADGYGLPYAYAGPNGDKSVTGRPLGGYGTMVPCIPGILHCADIPQLAALVAPRPLIIEKPLGASGKPVGVEDCDRAFAWTRQVYRLHGRDSAFRILPKAR